MLKEPLVDARHVEHMTAPQLPVEGSKHRGKKVCQLGGWREGAEWPRGGW